MCLAFELRRRHVRLPSAVAQIPLEVLYRSCTCPAPPEEFEHASASSSQLEVVQPQRRPVIQINGDPVALKRKSSDLNKTVAPKRNRLAHSASILIVPGPLPDNCLVPYASNNDKMNVSWSCLRLNEDTVGQLTSINAFKGFIFRAPDQDPDYQGSILVYAHYTVCPRYTFRALRDLSVILGLNGVSFDSRDTGSRHRELGEFRTRRGENPRPTVPVYEHSRSVLRRDR